MATAIATATKHKISAQLSSRLIVLGSSVSVPPICYQKLYRMEGIRKVSFKLRQQFAGQQLQRQVFCSMPNRITVLCLSNEEYKASDTDTDISELFENWCKEHGKTYSSEEEKRYRFNIFQESYASITRHNQMGDSWTAGLNKFSDRTPDEVPYLCSGLSIKLSELMVTKRFRDQFQTTRVVFRSTLVSDFSQSSLFPSAIFEEGLISSEQFFQELEDYVRAEVERAMK